MRRDTSREILKRWEQECLYRFPPSTQNYVIFSFGVNDVMFEEGSTRIQTTESSENFKRILEKSQLSYHPYVIGPPPVADFLHNARIRELSLNFAQISLAMHVPYLSVVESLLNNSIWMQDVNQCDGAHPGRKGYEQITALVHGWKEWPFLQPV